MIRSRNEVPLLWHEAIADRKSVPKDSKERKKKKKDGPKAAN